MSIKNGGSKVEGLSFIVKKVSSFTYFTILHIPSGQYALKLDNAPTVKVSEFKQLANIILKDFNWNVSESELNMRDGLNNIQKFRQYIVLNNQHKYEISEDGRQLIGKTLGK